MYTCPICDKRLRSDNKSGYCRDHNNRAPSNRERVLASKRAEYQRNKAKYAKSSRLYKETHNGWYVDYNKKYYQANKDKLKQRSNEYRKNNPEQRAAAQDRRRSLAAVKMDKTDRLLSVEYRRAIAQDNCFYCGAVGEQTDHYFPLAKGGTDHWYNLVRSCAFCNNSKSAKCGTKFLLSK